MSITREQILSRQCTVGVIGLGYVGYPLALLFAEAGFSVLGFDTDTVKVDSLNRGQGYIRHIPQSRLDTVIEQKKLLATADFALAAQCDALLICVPTPLSKNLEPDLHYIESTCKAIAPHLQPGTLVCLESTTWPGTTDEIVAPILSSSHLKIGENLFLAFSPEREDPGNQQYQTHNIPKLVGADDPASLDIAIALYSEVIQQVVRVNSTRVAEAAKLFENVFRSVNIALVNELKVLLNALQIDVWQVLEAAATKPFGFMSFWPGPGLGGHCIPIDPFYLAWKAREVGVPTRFIELAGEINRSMPRWVVGKVQDCLNDHAKALKGSKILVLGLSYKPDIDDMRESPTLELMRLLEEKGAKVDYHDPHLIVLPPNREYPELIGRHSVPLSSDYDCFLISTRHSCFSADNLLSYAVPIVDTRHLLPKHQLVYSA